MIPECEKQEACNSIANDRPVNHACTMALILLSSTNSLPDGSSERLASPGQMHRGNTALVIALPFSSCSFCPGAAPNAHAEPALAFLQILIHAEPN